MKRFEFITKYVHRRDGTPPSQTDHPHPEDVDAVLNTFGAEGWEPHQIDGSIIRLKREIPDDEPAFHPG